MESTLKASGGRQGISREKWQVLLVPSTLSGPRGPRQTAPTIYRPWEDGRVRTRLGLREEAPNKTPAPKPTVVVSFPISGALGWYTTEVSKDIKLKSILETPRSFTLISKSLICF